MKAIAAFLLLVVPPVYAQDGGLLTQNPLAGLKREVDRVLGEAGFPFSDGQNSQIVLMMEERRRASEELFGNLQDFATGPTQGQQSDQLRSAIEWMEGEFLSSIGQYLTAEQATVWDGLVRSGGIEGAPDAETGSEADTSDQTQYVRIHNNAYTAEDDRFRLGRNGGGQAARTEVIQRGGAGGFDGNVEFLLRDDALNARNPFANNKPDSQERQLRIDVSGPLIRGRLTSRVFFFQREAENVDAVRATLPTGVFDLGIVRPTTTRSYAATNTVRLGEPHSLDLAFEYFTTKGENQGVGGFTLPERAYTTTGDGWNFSVRQFSLLSGQDLFESRFAFITDSTETLPITEGFQINVLDAFNRGGAQNRSENTNRNYEFSSMYTHVAERWTLKTGVEGVYRTRSSLAENNFGGTFTFSSLDSFLADQPVNFRINSGDPLLEISQLETAFFVQNDFKLAPQFTLMAGLRYTNQTNLNDNKNIEPRLSFAWGIGPNTVLRGGAAIFTQLLSINVLEAQERLNGTRQFETIIDSPSFPDPFQAGTVQQTFPSIRITDPNLVSPYEVAAGIQLERTFFTNMFLSVTYNNRRELRRHRLRDNNAPYPACVRVIPSGLEPAEDSIYVQGCRPDPLGGVILNLEPTSREVEHLLRLNYRQRFSIFNVQAGYTLNRTWADGSPSSSPSIPSDNYDLGADWSLTPMPRHQFQMVLNAELPLGLFLTGRLSSRTGQKYTILTGRDDNRDGRLTDRPPGVGRNAEPGPNFHSVDFNISKAFFLANRGQNVNVFANMSNAFNHLNPGRPSGVLTSPNFGLSTTAQNPREIEMGIRYQF